jgi:hypothetical protein
MAGQHLCGLDAATVQTHINLDVDAQGHALGTRQGAVLGQALGRVHQPLHLARRIQARAGQARQHPMHGTGRQRLAQQQIGVRPRLGHQLGLPGVEDHGALCVPDAQRLVEQGRTG